MAVQSNNVCFSGEKLEELSELLKGVFSNDEEDFNIELESAATMQQKKVIPMKLAKKKLYLRGSWRGIKLWGTLEKVTPKKQLKSRQMFHQPQNQWTWGYC